jgi:glycerophosphoryl diester phosphodiesterase
MHKPESGRPQIVAHRGSSELMPEHTLGAYLAALEEGAEALECDVRLTSDGELVCVHDRTVRRTGGRVGNVSAMTLRELNEIDFGSWKNPWADLDDEAPDLDEDSQRVLTLRRLFEIVRDYDRPIDLAVETKHPTRYGALVERRVTDLLREFDWVKKRSPVRVMSFSLAAMLRIKRMAPKVETVFLMDREYQYLLTKNLPTKGWIMGPGMKLLRAQPVLGERLRDSGRRVHVWVANKPDDWDYLCDLGVEAIITDRPGEALGYLAGPGARFAE